MVRAIVSYCSRCCCSRVGKYGEYVVLEGTNSRLFKYLEGSMKESECCSGMSERSLRCNRMGDVGV